MKLHSGGSKAALRCLSRWSIQCYSHSARVTPVPALQNHALPLDRFREAAYKAEKPLIIKAAYEQGTLPAVSRWFVPEGSDEAASGVQKWTTTPYLEQFAGTAFPYELIAPQNENSSKADIVHHFQSWLSKSGDETYTALASILAHHTSVCGPYQSTQPQLLRFYAPLALLVAALKFNREHSHTPLTKLYIAQSALADLPPELQTDVPAPEIVRHAGKGDVYDSSVWLGLEPTYTPWHRDPNPNLFVQLCSSKTVRTMSPSAGEHVFRMVQMRLGQSGSSRIRGEEMMLGPEREALHEAIWGSDTAEGLREAHLDPGDSLFIPKGWWHSVKSDFADGRLNGSVNWWFR
ncbi:uncharacterized protein E0L32_004431 [Thyridium curvatum]|uniref:JmjC domain-containing protein n=1 Tax=Thyridium curvatum TaxID=1093900 RepID=A0A507BER5_9PEZI|nr:uncharacterized protein E0L32_004431 [Thyridium curvatum]TPX15451.1 hypothetical protein E0L32_004431 [Thyridium curvatum]